MQQPKGDAHPLDPLSAHELKEVVKHARSVWKLDHRHLFAMVQLHEPSKEIINSWKNSNSSQTCCQSNNLE